MSRHLLHIGYPKTGSTSLQEWFDNHPELTYAPGGLAGFHNVFEMCRPPLTAHRRYVTSCEHLSFPFTTDFTTQIVRPTGHGPAPQLVSVKTNQALVCATLSDIYPDSLVLVVTRGFRSMIISLYSAYLRGGGNLTLAGLSEVIVDSLQHDDSHYFDFDYLIGRYESAFGAGNVIVLPYELLRDDSRAFLAAIEARLALTARERSIGALRPGLSGVELFWYPRISSTVRVITRPLGKRLSSRLLAGYVAMIGGPKLSTLIHGLQRLRPGRAVTADDLPPEILSYCRGKASTLRGRPEFAGYWPEYLLS